VNRYRYSLAYQCARPCNVQDRPHIPADLVTVMSFLLSNRIAANSVVGLLLRL